MNTLTCVLVRCLLHTQVQSTECISRQTTALTLTTHNHQNTAITDIRFCLDVDPCDRYADRNTLHLYLGLELEPILALTLIRGRSGWIWTEPDRRV